MRGESLQGPTAAGMWALEDVPPFPWIASKVLQVFSAGGDDVAVKRLIDLIRADAALSSELLRRANSARYGMRSQISSLQHAAVVLGLDQVKNLAITAGVGSYLRAALRLSVLRRCWRHSLTCALLAEKLAPACGAAADQAYTAGLLHDLGRLALLVKYPQPYADLLSVVTENRFSLLASERDLFDIDHCHAGALLARRWDFPEQLQRVAERHHDPGDGSSFDLLRLVHLSCRLADSLGFAVAGPATPEDALEILEGLPARALSRLHLDIPSLKEELARRANALE